MRQNLTATSEDVRKFHKKISSNVKTERINQKISQLEMANLMGFESDTFYNYAENNNRDKKFNLEHLYLISKILNKEINYFIPDIISRTTK